MRIGILTIHHVSNYGAVWQAYALAKTVERLGFQVEIIDYRPTTAVKHYREWPGKSGRTNIRPYLNYHSFQRFVRKNLPLSRKLITNAAELASAAQTFDVLIAGSDQIWCTGEGSFRGFDANFFLDFQLPQTVQKVSYAASAGNTRDFSGHTIQVAEALRRFKCISVRDDATAKLIENVANVPATVVLDPVFLHSFDEVTAGVKPTQTLILFAKNPKRLEPCALELARTHGLRVVSLGKASAIATVNRRVLSPVAWLREINAARVVLTDYFHGAAVALHFGKPVLAFPSAGKRIKITDLFHRLDLMQLVVSDSEGSIDPSRRAIDIGMAYPSEYANHLRSKLELLRERSLAFLQNALSSDRPSVTTNCALT